MERVSQLQLEIEDQDVRAKSLENQIAKRHERIEEIKHELDELEEKARELTDVIGRNSEGEDGAKLETNKLITDKSEKQAALAHSNAVLSMLLDAAKRATGDG